MTSTFVRNLSLLFLIVLPVGFLPFSAASFDTVKYFFIVGFVVVAAVTTLFRRLGEPGKDASLTLVCVLAGVAALATGISTMLSPAPLLSWYGDGLASNPALISIALVGIFLLFMTITTSSELALRSIMVFIAAWTLVLVWEIARFVLGAFQITIPSIGFFLSSGINTIGRVTDLSLFMAFGVALLVALNRVFAMSRVQVVVLYGVTLLAGIVMFFAKFSLSWYLLAFIGLCAVCHALFFEKDRRVPTFPLVVVLVSFVMILGNQVLINAVYTAAGSSDGIARIDPYASVAEDVRPNFGATIDVASVVLKESPWLGAGPSRFSRAVHQSGIFGGAYYNTAPVWDTDFYAGHSMMATRLVTEGVVGLVAWATFIFAVAWFALRLACVAHKNSSKRFVAVALAGTALFAIGVLFWYPPSIVISALLFAFLGMASGFALSENAMPVYRYSLATNRRAGFMHAFGLVIGLLVVLSFGFTTAKGIAATYLYGTAVVATQDSRESDAVRQLAKAAYFVPESLMFRSVSDIQRSMALAILNSDSAESRMEEAAKLASDAVENAQKATVADATHYANFVTLARALSIGMPQTSKETSAAYEAAKPLAPRNPTILTEQAIVEAVSGNIETARMLIEGAIVINPNSTDIQKLRDIINETTILDGATSSTSSMDVMPEDELVPEENSVEESEEAEN